MPSRTSRPLDADPARRRAGPPAARLSQAGAGLSSKNRAGIIVVAANPPGYRGLQGPARVGPTQPKPPGTAPMPQTHDASTPRLATLKYQITSVLATGPTSTVLLIASRDVGGGRFALKVLKPDEEAA